MAGWVRNWLGRSALARRLDLGRRAWMRAMRPFSNELGIVELPAYPLLAARHLANCDLYPLREDILRAMPRSANVAELGVQHGDFSQKILDICGPEKLHLIDVDLDHVVRSGRFASEIASGRVQLHEADSATTIESFPDGHFDFIYIDADHSYDGVRRDIAAAHPKVAADGYLLFNDYTFWSSAECMPYGVIHAVNEFCLAENWEVTAFAFGHLGYSDVAIRRIRE